MPSRVQPDHAAQNPMICPEFNFVWGIISRKLATVSKMEFYSVIEENLRIGDN